MNRKGTQKKARRNCCNKYNMTDIELYRSRFAETNLAINNVRIKMVGRVCVLVDVCMCFEYELPAYYHHSSCHICILAVELVST